MIPKLYSARELSKLWDTSEDWWYERAAAGDLPSYMLNGLRRFDEADVLAYMEQNSEGAGLAEVRELRGVSLESTDHERSTA